MSTRGEQSCPSVEQAFQQEREKRVRERDGGTRESTKKYNNDTLYTLECGLQGTEKLREKMREVGKGPWSQKVYADI